jgi:uncharacterized membrane protein
MSKRKARPGAGSRSRFLTALGHTLRFHRTLFACALLGAATFLALQVSLLPAAWGSPARLVIGWDVGALAYLAFALTTITRFDLARARSRAAQDDEGRTLVLVLAVAAGMISLAAVIGLLGAAKNAQSGPQPLALALAIVTILISWAFIQVIFALHYAHEFFGGDGVGRGGGLKFPGDPHPDYWDFVYFSFVIGMTFQVSDVQVTGKRVRRLVVAHGIVSFVFSVTIIALTVNIASGLI